MAHTLRKKSQTKLNWYLVNIVKEYGSSSIPTYRWLISISSWVIVGTSWPPFILPRDDWLADSE